MQIDQVVGGVGGDTTAQAIQLKMRFAGNQFVIGNGQLIVRDAAGNNATTLSTFSTFDGGAAVAPTPGNCKEILLVTPAMRAKASPPITGAFDMIPIPPAFLAAGSLTFEGQGSTWWRVSWGGASYTGSDAVVTTNFTTVHANPAFGAVLPSASTTALKFQPQNCPAGTNNAADYAVTPGAATLVNNATAAFTVVNLLPVPALPGAAQWLLPGILGLGVVAFGFLRRRTSEI
ncbi:MAG TPA: hypothetical protein VMR50_14440 [Myxococcota bacterium]|nr:hypothetical protein [Myxococcota bacterium]